MTRDDIRKLIGGYATGTLTDAERKTLFEAAVDDQELFDELAAEQSLKEMLDVPGARERLVASLAPRRRSWYARPWPWASAAALGAAAVVVAVSVRHTGPELLLLTSQEITRRLPPPPAGPVLNPAAPNPPEPNPAEPESPEPKQSAAQPAGTTVAMDSAVPSAKKTVASAAPAPPSPQPASPATRDSVVVKKPQVRQEEKMAAAAPHPSPVRAPGARLRASNAAGFGGVIGETKAPVVTQGALAMQYRLDTGGQLHVWARSPGYLRVLGATGDFSETLYPSSGDGSMTPGQQVDVIVHGASVVVDFFKSPPPAVIPGIAGDVHVKDAESAVRSGFIQDPNPSPGSVLIVRIKRY